MAEESHIAERGRRHRLRLLFGGLCLSSVLYLGLSPWWSGTPDRALRFPVFWQVKARGVGLEPKATYAWHREDAHRENWIVGTNAGNIHASSYIGPEACAECHQGKHTAWSGHPHRRMNQIADESTVLGDFSDRETMDYLGGKIRFFKTGDQFRMRWWRAERTNEYVIQRTIGSRFSQVYTGLREDLIGSTSEDAHLDEVVLPFTWWIERREWSPVKHVHGDVDSDEHRWDVFRSPPGRKYSYDMSCSDCHTTFPFGERMLRNLGENAAKHLPQEISLAYRSVLHSGHTNDMSPTANLHENLTAVMNKVRRQSSQERAVALGISCESCHFGCREHALNSTPTESKVRPSFYPKATNLFVRAADAKHAFDRSPENKNFLCAQCHIGERPMYASGHHTWNSTEYTDAVNGFCYSRPKTDHGLREMLTCVHCHEPHQGIGQRWRRSRREDNLSCLHCHESFKDPATLVKHTRHLPTSVGSDCMNCHMPKINEGLSDLVRTHRICNPTDARMIEANQPNACNICHVEKSIDWTLKYLGKWYGHTYDEAAIDAAYSNRTGSVAIGWLQGTHAPTRLVAARALVSQRAHWAMPKLVDTLDDSHFVNRQYLERWLEEWTGADLRRLGYRHYHTEEQRPAHIEKVRQTVNARLSSTGE